MKGLRQKSTLGASLVAILLVIGNCFGTPVFACAANVQSCSTNYSVDETYFGTGGQLCIPGTTGSTNYCAKQSAGETGVGNTASTNYQAQAGFNTDRSPYLELDITAGATSNVGYLSAGSTATATTTFKVKSYLANSYIVQIVGNPPTNNAASPHSLTALTGCGTSSAGTEQFGVNLVANTTPSVGSNLTQLPDSTFGFGAVAGSYGTPNTFCYNSGDTIAQSSRSSGFTQFVISYIFNISSLTPDGQYTYNGSLVATSTF